jgi:hypothetical protein
VELTHRPPAEADDWTDTGVGEVVGAVVVGAAVVGADDWVGADDGAADFFAVDDDAAGIDASATAAGAVSLARADGDALRVSETCPLLPLWKPADPQPPRARAAITPAIAIDFFLMFLAPQPVAVIGAAYPRIAPRTHDH